MKKDHSCPFCSLKNNFIIKKNRFALLTIARAPYTKDHLLVIPRKHTKTLHNLKPREKAGLMSLITIGMDALHKKYKGVEISYKEGDSLADAGKSIKHMHFHLVPKKKVKVEVDTRKFYSEKVLFREISKIKDLIKK